MSSNYCVVFGCRNSVTSSNKQKTDCRFLNFPLDQEDLTKTWLQKLNLEGWTPGPESLICEEHFSLDSFDVTENKRVLKPGAVPTIVDELDRILLQYEILLNNHPEEVPLRSVNDEGLRCRICAAFISLQDAVDVYSDDGKVIVKILTCIPILMKTQDYLPKYICRFCLSDLNTSYRMLIRAIESEKFFSALLMNGQKSDEHMTVVEETGLQSEKLPDEQSTGNNLKLNDMENQNTSIRKKNDRNFDLTNSTISNQFHSLDNPEDHTPIFAIVELSDTISSKLENQADNRVCDICNVSFSNLADLNFHTENIHANLSALEMNTSKSEESSSEVRNSRLFTCQHCSTTYQDQEELNEHLETHVISVWYEDGAVRDKSPEIENTSTPTYMCNICFTVFPTRGSLERHSKRVHKLKYAANATVRKYTCEECGKEFKNRPNLTIHERVHTGARPFVCENCGSSFRSRANLIQHLIIHSGVKKYKCAVCLKAFSRKGFVDAHMRVHTGERPFKCSICESKYSQVGDLRRHMQKCQRKASCEKKLVTRKNYCRRKRETRDRFIDDAT